MYGADVAKQLKETGLFRNVIFPLHTNDKVDGVLQLHMSGTWKADPPYAGYIIGVTLGFMSPFIGPSMQGTHAVTVSLIITSYSQVQRQRLQTTGMQAWVKEFPRHFRACGMEFLWQG